MGRFLKLSALPGALALAACASITDGTMEKVAVTTTPMTGATCQLKNEKGSWTVSPTPGDVMVGRADGPLTVTCTHPDGDAGSSTVTSGTSLSTFGNALIGGLVGVAVDINSGAAYHYPETISVALSPAATGGVASAAPPPPASAAAGTPAEPANLPWPVVQAVRFCQVSYGDPRLAALHGVIALDRAPSLEMQSDRGHLTAEQKTALNALQPLHDACRAKLMAADPALARVFEQSRLRNADFLDLYEGKTTVGEFNRAAAEDFERLDLAMSKLGETRFAAAPAITAPPPAPAVPAAAPSAAAPTQPEPAMAAPPAPAKPMTAADYCVGLMETQCFEHLHRTETVAQ